MAMLLNWGSPRNMARHLSLKEQTEALKFYEDYIAILYGSPDEDKDDVAETPWDAEVMYGEMT